MTTLPASLPRQASKSRSRFIGATTTGAVIVPPVPGVHATGIAVSWMTRGAVIRTLDDTIDQPRPNGKPSLWTLRRPHDLNCDCVHASACRICGELVSREPI